MSAVALPVLAFLATLLLALGVAAAAFERLAVLAAALLCGLGAVVDLLYLMSGATPVVLTLPLGLPGQSTLLGLDGVSGFFALLLLLAGMAGCAAALDEHAPQPTAPALPVFLAAMLFTLLAADAVAIVAGFELMSAASFILVLSAHNDSRVRAAGLLYYGMAAISGLCLIVALALLSADGTAFSTIRDAPPEGLRAACVLGCVLIGAGSKAGLAPLHLWLPPAHAAAPSHVSALMSGAMTKVAIYVMIRLLFDLCGPAQPLWWGLPLLAMGVASAVIGALRANLETDIKAILACSTIENVGLVTIGLGIAMAARAADLSALTALALGAALLHAMAHGLFKAMLFLCAGAIQHATGTRLLSRLGGLITSMPGTSAGLLLGAACLAGLPPGAGFAGEWLLFQSVIAAVRIGGLGLQILVCVLAAGVALATALAAAAALRLVGVALLGRPRSAEAAAAHEAGPPMRWAILGLGTLTALIGLVPGAVLGLAAPALRILGDADLADRAGLLGVGPHDHAGGYAPLGLALLMALAGVLVLAVLRAWAVAGHRVGPAWDCGFGAAPSWLPNGDPLTQYGGASFSQPLRRVLASALLFATQRVDMPEPGDVRPAIFSARLHDPAQVLIFAPIGHLRARLSGLADRVQFLTVRQTLSVIFTALVAFLGVIALLEQL